MPRIRDQHGRTHALSFPQHVAKQPLFGDEDEHGNDKRAQMNGGDALEIGEARAGTP